jgi:DNA polymerase-3 subunit epsilon
MAFVDVETTGLDPQVDRIAEIGVVLATEDRRAEWCRLLRPGQARMAGTGAPLVDAGEAPSFATIAEELIGLLRGRLLIAHNARFDYGFLRAEFERCGLDFRSDVLCTLRLSRALDPHHCAHDMDSILARWELRADARHRALPDALLVEQYWNRLRCERPQRAVLQIADKLIAGPQLPAHLDPSLVDDVPDKAGVLELHGDDGLLHTAAAANLRAHLTNYFRLDLASTRALSIAARVKRVRWRRTAGIIGARLIHITRLRESASSERRARRSPAFALRFDPARIPSVELVDAFADDPAGDASYGLFTTERKARNAVRSLARTHALCGAIMGIDRDCRRCCHPPSGCPALVDRVMRSRHLVEVLATLRPLHLCAWPYAGPIAIRERNELHVIDRWRYLGTARCMTDARELQQIRAPAFDSGMYAYLRRLLRRLPPRHVMPLLQRPHHSACRLGG